MYKTVRKGDASLQYTILPQTDQFSTSFPQTGKPRPRIIKYTMATLMILIILSCVATPFLMNQNDHNLFASTVLAMGRMGHTTRNTTRSPTVGVKTRARLTTEVYRRVETSTRAQEEEEVTTDISSTHTSTSTESTSVQPSIGPPLMSTPWTIPSSTTPKTSSTEPPKIGIRKKMPRVTLKLRENETIPQMYMKAGIASYKKGNITTSVLAHGLSLEGLIFKTPEGTIKPWTQKWFFTDSSSDFQWKGANQMPVTIYVVLAVLATLAGASTALMFYVQRRASRRQRQSVEEPETEGHEDKSTLLGAEQEEKE